MKIKNFEHLATSDLRKHALEIANAGLEAIDTTTVINSNLKVAGDQLLINNLRYSFSLLGRIFFVGVGKCSLEAGAIIEKILGDKLTAGVVVDVHLGTLEKIRTFSGTHPFPSEQNVDATKEIINQLKDLNENDLVIFLISGGGSTLLCQPENMTCLDEAKLIKTLFAKGADIQKINTIRKHLSLARGGYLAQYAYPAQVVSLIFSDVPGNNLGFIASGPTVKDETTIADAQKILTDFAISNVTGLLETPKDDKYFSRVKNLLVVSSKTALEAMANHATELGLSVTIITEELSGEASNEGMEIVSQGRQLEQLVGLFAGETTVTVKGPGKGGRNLELALGALKSLQENELLLSLASDGRDNCELAGAIVDWQTHQKVVAENLDIEDFLSQNDSFRFFNKVGDYLLTDETGSNVSDLVIYLKQSLN